MLVHVRMNGCRCGSVAQTMTAALPSSRSGPGREGLRSATGRRSQRVATKGASRIRPRLFPPPPAASRDGSRSGRLRLRRAVTIGGKQRGVATGVVAAGLLWLATLVAGRGQVVISQIYGGGGNAGAPYRNDFVELFNAGAGTVSLAGWAIQYASGGGSSWQA